MTLPLSPLRRPRVVVPALLFGSLLFGAGFGLTLGAKLPSVDALREWRPPTVTTIRAADGSVLSRIGEEKRIVIEYGQIPKRFIQAIIATEDAHFYQHFGVDPSGIARAAISNVTSRRWRSPHGGSTITQQLARGLFLKADKTYKRKMQEAVLALQIERGFTKEEILTFYANQVNLGHGRYGVEAASELYYRKPAREMTLAQCALLAGIMQSPDRLSPIRHPEASLRRRTHVLSRMAEEGFISRAEATAAGREPLDLVSAAESRPTGSYFVEEVRRYLLKKYGEEALYRDGLTAETTLDPVAQRAAETAIAEGVLEVDRRRGFRRKWKNVSGSTPLTDYKDPSWASTPPDPGRILPGLVTSVTATSARLRVGSYSVTIAPDDVRWTGRLAMTGVVKPGDLVPVRVKRRDESQKRLEVEVVPSPDTEGALIAIDSATGEVRALVGGFDFHRSEFDRAVQARRQAGSAFKPFLFSVALESRMTPSDMLFDEPTVLLDPQTAQPYQPENHDRRYTGRTTLRSALEESRNIVSVLLLDHVGYRAVIDRARSMGVTARLAPYPSMALGAFEISLLEITSAYSIYPNQGIRAEPHFIRRVRDRDGKILEEIEPELREVLKPETAFQMTWLLKGVAEEGTAAAVRSLGRPLAGKTGTTDDYSDAWFVGFSPSLTCGVWVGTDRKETLGRGETGAKAALPIWISFFEKYLEKQPVEDFLRPPGINLVPVDRRTGLRAGADTGCGSEDVILEAFAAGTEPVEYCSPAEHARAGLPYFLQRFPVTARVEIVATPAEIAAVIQAGPRAAHLSADGWRLEVVGEGGTVSSVPLALDGEGHRELQRLLAEPPIRQAADGTAGTSVWYGLDGRLANVITIHPDE